MNAHHGKPLIQVFQEAELDSGELEILEIYYKGKLRKFEVLSREWSDEKAGIDLILRNVVPPKNWVTKSREHKAFQSHKGVITFYE